MIFGLGGVADAQIPDLEYLNITVNLVEQERQNDGFGWQDGLMLKLDVYGNEKSALHGDNFNIRIVTQDGDYLLNHNRWFWDSGSMAIQCPEYIPNLFPRIVERWNVCFPIPNGVEPAFLLISWDDGDSSMAQVVQFDTEQNLSCFDTIYDMVCAPYALNDRITVPDECYFYAPEKHWICDNISTNNGSLISDGYDTVTVLNTVGSSIPGCEETDDCFMPQTVVIPAGGKVAWKNVDTAAHTITSGTTSGGSDGVFDSGLFAPETEFSYTFEMPGEYPYYCMVHPWMSGIVIVKDPLHNTTDNYDNMTPLIESSNDGYARIPDFGDFKLIYEPNPNSPYIYTAKEWLQDTKILDYEIEWLNENFRLSHDVNVIVTECGEENAFYNDGTVTICYEYIDHLDEMWRQFNPDDTAYAETFTTHVLIDTLYHEIGHAILDIYALPYTGLEENVADQFSALMLSYTYNDEIGYNLGQNMMYDVGNYYWYSSQLFTDTPYWDTHAHDMQRFYNISCYSYGADPAYNMDLIEEGWLPEDRAVWCVDEYEQINYAFGYLLQRYTNGLFD